MFRKFLPLAIAATILAVASLSAHADGDWTAVMANNSGGKIMLSNMSCPDEPGSIAKAYGKGNDVYGCYTYNQNTNTVAVSWIDPSGNRSYRTYSFADFSWTSYGKKLSEAAIEEAVREYKKEHPETKGNARYDAL